MMPVQGQIHVEGAPTAPRQIVRASESVKDEELNLHRNMDLLRRLGEYQGQGPMQREDKRCSENRYSLEQLRRSFVDSVCYLCDIKTMGGTVTAGALRKYYLRKGMNQVWDDSIVTILYLAANETILPEVHNFVESLIKRLRKVTPDNRQKQEAIILRDALGLGNQRMGSYHAKMKEHLNKCRTVLQSIFKDQHRVLSWIEDIERETDMYHLSQLCYEARERQLEEMNTIGAEHKDILELVHYIGRLGAHRYAVSMIVTAWMKVPALRRIKRHEFLPAAEARPILLPGSVGNFAQTCKSICTSPFLHTNERRDLYAQLYARNYTSDFALEEELERLRHLVTRVHAELLVVDFFSRKKLEFIDGDKYIGCSKPACYFCYKWITLHPDGYVPPATHNRVIPSCRGPDVDAGEDRNGRGAKLRSMQIGKMLTTTVRDIQAQLGEGLVSEQPRHQSSNGSTRAPSSAAASRL
ncbi:hypothetical protein BJX64DRAFT_249344 [Aspergillus heterothallicus]